ncbi:MAG: Na+:solute symporter [Planctomycetes bacterium SM23_25]|nr:MAG: Na+:solute symporter [Planctomycetes bacterium SM23_25]
MRLVAIDWVIIVGYVAFGLIVCAVYVRRASRGTSEFFLSGRSGPWWLLGTSMVATTFSTDTPNLVTNIVRQDGVAGNWVWWAFLLTGMMTVFFYARLWRRSGVMTDLEFYEIRYSGKSAAVVRCFRSMYLGLFFNCVIMASVTLAAVKIANVLFGWPAALTVVCCAVLSIAFSVTAGLWGVVVTDLVQFAMAMTGAFAAAYYATQQDQVGGLAGLLERLDPQALSVLPDFGNGELLLSVLIIPLTVQWWSVWYPGAEPGGGSYVAQRMLAAKNERHSMGATLWFNVAHYALRPWPWMIVALCSMLVYPTLGDIQSAFPHVDPGLIGNDIAYPAMLKFLPPGFMGIMVGSLIAAYISTMDTHLNWGASYLVHDFYRRFIRPEASEKHYVRVSRVATAGLMVVAAVMVFFLENAKDSFDLMLSIGAGTGLIYLLRWFWWRINAWSEIAAMISSFCIAVALFVAKKCGAALSTHITLALSVALTTAVWVIVTVLTRPTSRETLRAFYRLVRPAGPGWRDIRRETGLGPSPDSLPHAFLGWVLGCALVYAALFGTGSWLYGQVAQGTVCLVVFIASGLGLAWLLPRILGGRDHRQRRPKRIGPADRP